MSGWWSYGSTCTSTPAMGTSTAFSHEIRMAKCWRCAKNLYESYQEKVRHVCAQCETEAMLEKVK